MKILTKEEEAAHYNATVKGGSIGGLIGLAVGGTALYVANARFQTIRGLTIPMKSFLVSSTGTFTAIICADRASRSYEWNRDPQRKYKDKSTLLLEQERANETTAQRLKAWGKENRYSIVTASWAASMGIAFGIVSRNKFLTGAQKLVQARVYAQGLTLAVLVASAAFEMGDAKTGTGRWETVTILDPNDPEHKHLIQKKIHHEAYEGEDLWRDMVEAEERRIENRKREAEERQHSSELTNAGKAAFADAKAKEDKSQAEQAEKEAAAKKEAAQAEAKGTKLPQRTPYFPTQHHSAWQYTRTYLQMEAASARMAARDRFSMMGDPGPSPLQRYIQQACSPENYEPNLAMNLEISDLINSKKGNAPREAAMAIVNYINHRNPNVAILALVLLDICVKNCGYPFHLQISTKEFLNELVRRFPERPPIRASKVQMKILEAIEEWRGTICQTSRYKEDLGFIRDMHRLLSYKGYVFPEVRVEDAAVLNPSDNLKSAEEMEEEERAAQSAKLQELIRRGGPEDLQEANRLMKIMAGYDTRSKTDYRAKAAEEVGKVQQKARLLEERLEEFKPGDIMTEGDVYEELASALQSAHPKIQKMCEEESDDHEAVAKLLEINDSIHRTVERYKLMKKGDVDAASKIAKGTLGTSTGVSKNSANELSLIDFDGEPETNGSSSNNIAPVSTSHSGSLEDDLLGLSLGEASYSEGGGISLGFGNNTSIPGPALMSSTTENSTAKGPTPTTSPAPSHVPMKPDYSAFSAFGSSQPQSKPTTPQPSLLQQQQQLQQQAAISKPPSNIDPFAALTSPRQATPQQSGSIFDFANPKPPVSNAANVSVLAADDDEWAFSSALPEGLPSTNDLTINNTNLKISLNATREPNTHDVITLSIAFSNNSNEPISDLTFQAAVTKGYTLKLLPQSGRMLNPRQSSGITQKIYLQGVEHGKGDQVKMRWKCSYQVGTQNSNEQGEIASLGIS